jgi:hypothetical protein
MGPLEMVLTKQELCEVIEKHWGPFQSITRVHKILACGDERELEAEFKRLGLELMEVGKREAGWEFAKIWKSSKEKEQDSPAARGATQYALDDEEEEDTTPKPSLAKELAKGLSKAFARAGNSTTDGLASAGAKTVDNAGAVTEWQDVDEVPEDGRRIGLGLAKAEMGAIVSSKLGVKGAKVVERIQESRSASELALAIGEAQRKLVKAAMPRLAGKLAKKWLEIKGRIE